MRNSRVSAVLVAAVVSCVQAVAQPQPANVASWLARIADAETSGGAPYRLYDIRDHVKMEVTLAGDIGEPFSLTHGAVVRAVRWRVERDGRAIPITADWSSEAWVGIPPARTRIGLGDTLRFQRGFGVQWTVILRRSDGERFVPGRYLFQVSWGNGLETARTDSGAPWDGAAASPGRNVHLIVHPPTSAAERAAAFRQQGDSARENGRVDHSVRFYELAVEVDPTNKQSLISLGNAYVGAKRFRDAIPLLERANPTNKHGSTVHLFLALAYLGIDDEGNALRVLKEAGQDDQRVAATIQQLRTAMYRREP